MLKKMNLPNKLTMIRIFLVPLFILFMAIEPNFEWSKSVALGIFIVASITDYLDGYLSRKYSLVTNFGKIMDPLADKLLISSGFIMLTAMGIIPGYICAIIIFRDFFVNAIRMFGANNEKTIAAALSGKIKTASQMIAIILGLLDKPVVNGGGFLSFINNSINMTGFELGVNVFMSVMVIVATLATLWSLVDYTFKFKECINVEE